MHAADVPRIYGATHFEEVSLVFHNIAGLGYHYGKPFAGMSQSYIDLSTTLTSMWASLNHDSDPNSGVVNTSVHWDAYSMNQPVDLLLDAYTT